MGDRYTKKDAEKCAERLAKTLNKDFGNCWKKDSEGNLKAKIGCWRYDHNSVYGGGNVEEIMNENGGIDQPFGSRRLKPDAFCAAVNMAEKAVSIARREDKK